MYLPKEHDPRTSTIIIEPVGASCNLSCRYCYHANIRESKTEIMPENILKKLIKNSLQINNNRVKFLWHGGEPLLAGINFFKNVITLQKKYQTSQFQQISNHLQTNATMIDSEWAAFFKNNFFKISTSIDGPDWLHNKYRYFRNGYGSFDKTLKGIKLLNQYDLTVGVVVTINKYNVNYPNIVYQTLIDLGIKSFEFNIASKVPGSKTLSPNKDAASIFLKRTFDLWFDSDDPSVYIRIFHNVIRSLLGMNVRDCTFSYNRCREYIASDEKGNLYSCGRFLKEKVAYLGHCFNKPLIEILSDKKTQHIFDLVSKVKKECLECKWLGACGGGCAYQRWLNGGFGSLFPQCEIRKSLFKYVEKKIKKYLNKKEQI